MTHVMRPMKAKLFGVKVRAGTIPLLAVASIVVSAEPARAQSSTALTTATPEEVGLSSAALARIEPAMQGFLDAGRTGGILTLVARRGEVVHRDAQGWRVVDEDPLEPDDVFRIYSMTKPVTSVAAMILVEDGKLSLDDEVAKHIRAFADVQVYEEGALRAPDRPMLVRHLLTHTSGLTYGVFGNSPVDSMYVRELRGLSTHTGRDLAATANLIASLPLIDDPGDRWNYSVSTDVLGRVVEVASGMTLEEFFQTRIFDPLRMDETGFHVPAERLDRLLPVYTEGDNGLEIIDSHVDGPFTRPPSWFSGGGGLTSTADDYLRFCQMLLNGGELDGARVLREATVREMTRNHLPEEMIPIFRTEPGQGFGLGFAVDVEGEDAGRFWWSGVASTYFFVDPVRDLVGFAWTQFQPYGRANVDLVLRPLVYEAIIDGN